MIKLDPVPAVPADLGFWAAHAGGVLYSPAVMSAQAAELSTAFYFALGLGILLALIARVRT